MQEALAFRNIQYARASRFAAAELLSFDGLVQQRARGPLAPQNPSRYEPLLGALAPLAQAEDCQVLSIFTPALSGRRPVMIWFHGGAFITGGGELPWYDGTLLAGEQDVVVACVTSRLGVLGHLCLDGRDGGTEGPSPATTDQMAAIEWVHRQIDQFGGDPDDITLFGQSAGGFAIEIMLRWGLGAHVKGAIIQSGFIKENGLVYKREDAVRQADAFTALAGRPPRSLSVAELLDAQQALTRQVGASLIWAPVRPDVERPIGIPIVAGVTHHDTLPYILMERGIDEPQPLHFEMFAAEIQRRNDAEITAANCEILDEAFANGGKGWLYEFCWDVPESGWGAPHCIDLPYLLGDREVWSCAAILRGADWDLLNRRGRSVRTAWASFAHIRSPGAGWIEYDPASRPVNRLEGDFGMSPNGN
jgi:para-nitrobenzyl esterase